MHNYLPHTVTLLLLLAGIFYVRIVSVNPYSAFQYYSLRQKSIQTHPIDHLIRDGLSEYKRVIAQSTNNVNDAAAAYRARRGRHPPPTFDKWVEFAKSKGSIINEQFFDRIYHDLEPFWGMDPYDIRYFAQTWVQSISVRNGVAQQRNGTIFIAQRWMSEWLGAVKEIEHLLPDVDMAFNNVDEPRVIASWEEINGYMEIAKESRHTKKPSADTLVENKYSRFPELAYQPPAQMYNYLDVSMPYWEKSRRACHPESPGRKAGLDMKLDGPIDFPALLAQDPVHNRYVNNWTSSHNPCEHPELRYLHAACMDPSSGDVSYNLIPIFSGCKVAGIHNDILAPAAEYFSTDAEYGGDVEKMARIPWKEKKTMAIWRGTATGGKTNISTWRHYQRHRFNSLLNATTVTLGEQLHYPQNLALLSGAEIEHTANLSAGNVIYPNESRYNLAALETTPTSFGKWISGLVDSGFTHLRCAIFAFHDPGDKCDYDDFYYHQVPYFKQHDMFKYKYLPDIDGQSYSGRYRSFLESSSLPIKATVFAEWHDGRLFPWYHFVPLHNSFKDWWGILEYFAGYNGAALGDDSIPPTLQREAHDDEARIIAANGMEWSKKVLRREDMVVYLYRLILEYARICDDKRLDIGWAEDLR